VTSQPVVTTFPTIRHAVPARWFAAASDEPASQS
jgi:hypothetical protein